MTKLKSVMNYIDDNWLISIINIHINMHNSHADHHGLYISDDQDVYNVMVDINYRNYLDI